MNRVDLFNCHTGRTLCRLPAPAARIVAVVLSRLTGRTYDYAPAGKGWL